VPMKLPSDSYIGTISTVILDCECATAFEEITRNGVKEEGVGQFWANTFRSYRFLSAVDYIRANRLRTKLMQAMAKAMEAVDVYVGGNDLVITNLTGHPSICIPNGFTKGEPRTPTAITFTGQLYGETDLLTVAKAFQETTAFHKERPPLD
jgi:hypothetical protein